MSLFIENRHRFIKKSLRDVWNHHILYQKPARSMDFIRVMKSEGRRRYYYYKRDFIYSFAKRIRFRRKKYLKDDYIGPRYIRNYYLLLTKYNFYRYYYTAKKKQGSFERNYLGFLEGRIFMILYRSNFINNIFSIKYAVKAKIFFINKKVVTHYNYCLKISDVLHIKKSYLRLFFDDILMRLEQNIIFWKTPDYMVINNNLLFIFYWKKPLLKNLNFRIFRKEKYDLFFGNIYSIP